MLQDLKPLFMKVRMYLYNVTYTLRKLSLIIITRGYFFQMQSIQYKKWKYFGQCFTIILLRIWQRFCKGLRFEGLDFGEYIRLWVG